MLAVVAPLGRHGIGDLGPRRRQQGRRHQEAGEQGQQQPPAGAAAHPLPRPPFSPGRLPAPPAPRSPLTPQEAVAHRHDFPRDRRH
ncbi:MAG: hypothetical protein D6809_06655 [Gammaproteobacteria bacterium]|nr:MAG: hypothetical protein D6809_06655 [Gammaproteobacteria bacterium]